MFRHLSPTTQSSFVPGKQPRSAELQKPQPLTDIQLVQHIFENETSSSLENFFDGLLMKYSRGRISSAALLALFEAELAHSGLTGLQWMMAQKQHKMILVVYKMLSAMEKQGILTSAKLLDLVTQPNIFGHSAYYYALRSQDRTGYGRIAAIVYKAFKGNRISAEAFHQVLAQKDKKGATVLTQAFSYSPMPVLRFYFYQWENSLDGGSKAYKRFAEALTATHRVIAKDLSTYDRAPLHNILQVGEVDALDLYLKNLRFCLSKEALTKKSYFTALTPRMPNGATVLQWLCYKSGPELLGRYLQELLYCAQERMASFEDLVELFRPLELNPSLYKSKPESMTFGEKQLANCFTQILRLNKPEQRVAELPGLQVLTQGLARSKNSESTSFFGASRTSPVQQAPYFYSFFEQQQSLKGEAQAEAFKARLEFQPQ